MRAFRFSRRAENDLLEIGEYTLRTWGKTQAARYLAILRRVARFWLTIRRWAETQPTIRPASHRGTVMPGGRKKRELQLHFLHDTQMA